jgi:hypothetical protein
MSLVGLLVAVLLVAVICWVLGMIPMEPRIRTILQIVVAVVFLLWVLAALGGWGPTIRVS